jgi:preprotein translocase subunit SecE
MGRLLRKKIVRKRKTDTLSPADTQTADISPVMPAAGEQKKTLMQKKAPGPLAGNAWVQKSMQFLREVRAEFRKVTWPSRKQTVGSTVVVIIVVVIISAFLGLVDMGLSGLLRVILQ